MPLDTSIAVRSRVSERAELVAIPFGRDLKPDAPELPVPVAGLLAYYEAKGDAGEIVEIPVARGEAVGRVLLYGVGDATEGELRRAGAALARAAKGRPSLSVVPPSGPVSSLVEGALLAAYSFSIGSRRTTSVTSIEIATSADAGDGSTVSAELEADVRKGEIAARAVALARDLANTPASVKSPAWLAERAEEQGLPTKVWTERELRAEGFGGILAVGAGSAYEPRLIKLSYEPEGVEGEQLRHVVLVGKGITFDSGGLSLKPTDNMKLQKTDMSGGAVVIAVMSALRDLGVRTRVTGLIASAENMPSGSAMRPGDVITQYGGRTVEVLNTDAEGRLVLADALAYADAELDPDVMIDIATLTGAVTVALGRDVAALFANDDDLAGELVEAGQAVGDRLWRMPLIEDYMPAIKSAVADLANLEAGKRHGADAVTAALFLREFTGRRPWAHLDIAGAGRSMVDAGILSKGATGFGVRLLLDWLARDPAGRSSDPR
ncbi:leucyl aminopeptidase [Sinosporangium album]|uniref:Probable cytosol aminopeptidase n=1 Tax=Sinosporangium album TaxID=504805 RepID=A0A1G7Y5Q0_9ACTN|nr:leucyl aminopeptidase [Sinosporangium album]SDG91798.1 leucyl aminopeptidase [Sinosporangium album]